MLTETTLNNAIDQIIATTRNRVMPNIEPNDDILPILFVLNRDGQPEDIARLPLPATFEGRERFHQCTAQALHEMGAAGYVVLFMGWSLKFEGGKEWDGTRPSESPDRIEALIVNAGSSTASVSRLYEAKRDTIGKLVELVPIDGGEAQVKGLFVDMLRGKETMH